jgi:hypothetical protein
MEDARDVIARTTYSSTAKLNIRNLRLIMTNELKQQLS